MLFLWAKRKLGCDGSRAPKAEKTEILLDSASEILWLRTVINRSGALKWYVDYQASARLEPRGPVTKYMERLFSFFSFFAKFRQRGSKKGLKRKSLLQALGKLGGMGFWKTNKKGDGLPESLLSPSVRADNQPLILGLYSTNAKFRWR